MRPLAGIHKMKVTHNIEVIMKENVSNFTLYISRFIEHPMKTLCFSLMQLLYCKYSLKGFSTGGVYKWGFF